VKASLASFCIAVAVAPLPAIAGPISYSFSSGSRSATVEFVRSGSDLIVTLTNTSTADALVPTDILTGVFAEIMCNPVLTPVSAIVPVGSSVFEGGTGVDVTPGDRVVGGEWAYTDNVVVVPPNNQGLSSVGLGIFGPGDVFPGDNLQGPESPDGVQYGLTTAGDNLLTGNGGITGPHLIKNSVVLTLSGFTDEPDEAITYVTFQYGTGLDEPMFGVPEPASMVLLGAASLSIAAYCGPQRLFRRRTHFA
jgi:hypothetical protein